MSDDARMSTPAFGLNRFDFSTPDNFAQDVAYAESLGWDYAFVPDSQLRRHDTYVLLAFAAKATSRIRLGPLLANPVTRQPSVTAGSIATVDQVSNGRAILGYGIGDTAVHLAGLHPAKVATLEAGARLIKGLLHDEGVDVGARLPARLPHPRPVPVWLAAAGPRALRAAGRVADGVFIRAGTHPDVLHSAVASIRAGAEEAGRDPASVRLGLVLHTVLTDDPERALLIGKSMAAGYYEFSPHLFETAGIAWNGPDVHELQKLVDPDFHHHPDPVESGRLVAFLPEAAANAFSVRGTAEEVTNQIVAALSQGIDFDIVVPQPVPTPPSTNPRDGTSYMERVATEIIPAVKARLG